VTPAGSAGQNYYLEVSHAETVSAAAANVALTATIGSCVVNVPARSSTGSTVTLGTDTVALTTPACIAAVQSGFSLTFKAAAATSGKTFTENIDGVDLVNAYTPPGAHAESGCTIVINSCSVLTVGGTQAKFVSWGTVYAPLSSVSVNVTDTADVVSFRRGLIARAISIPNLVAPNTTNYFCLAAGSPCTGSTGTSTARIDLLTATVSGNVELRALVSYVDTPAPGTSLQILAWNPQR
jgi:hypothetical protein